MGRQAFGFAWTFDYSIGRPISNQRQIIGVGLYWSRQGLSEYPHRFFLNRPRLAILRTFPIFLVALQPPRRWKRRVNLSEVRLSSTLKACESMAMLFLNRHLISNKSKFRHNSSRSPIRPLVPTAYRTAGK